jgi:hypothetical protein
VISRSLIARTNGYLAMGPLLGSPAMRYGRGVVAACSMMRRLFYAARFLLTSQVKRCSPMENKTVCPILDIGIQIKNLFIN